VRLPYEQLLLSDIFNIHICSVSQVIRPNATWLVTSRLDT